VAGADSRGEFPWLLPVAVACLVLVGIVVVVILLVGRGGGDSVAELAATDKPPSADDDHGNDISSAASISTDVSYVAVIDFGGDVDFFSFTAQQGTAYIIETILGSLEDSHLYLYDSTESQIAFNDDWGDSSNSRIVWIAPASQTYFIAVSANDDSQTGRYGVSVSLPQTSS